MKIMDNRKNAVQLISRYMFSLSRMGFVRGLSRNGVRRNFQNLDPTSDNYHNLKIVGCQGEKYY